MLVAIVTRIATRDCEDQAHSVNRLGPSCGRSLFGLEQAPSGNPSRFADPPAAFGFAPFRRIGAVESVPARGTHRGHQGIRSSSSSECPRARTPECGRDSLGEGDVPASPVAFGW